MASGLLTGFSESAMNVCYCAGVSMARGIRITKKWGGVRD